MTENNWLLINAANGASDGYLVIADAPTQKIAIAAAVKMVAEDPEMQLVIAKRFRIVKTEQVPKVRVTRG